MSGLTALLILAYFALIALLVAIWLSVPGGARTRPSSRDNQRVDRPTAPTMRQERPALSRGPKRRGSQAEDPFEQFLKESERRRNR